MKQKIHQNHLALVDFSILYRILLKMVCFSVPSFETGMRIGEALALWLEDFDISGKKIHICDRGELENLAEIKTVESPRILDCTNELMDLFTEYVSTYHDADVETNHVLLKIRGDHKGTAMEYEDVDNLFRALRKKTGVYVTPHMFRHTSLI